jgi:outer membrane lipoprotein-sorting protein
MKNKILTLLISLFFYSGFAQTNFDAESLSDADLEKLVEQMMSNIKSIKTAKYRLVKTERYEGKNIKSEQLIKQNIAPMKINIKITNGPNTGTEVFFIKGMNKDRAVVSAGQAIPKVSLSPNSPLVRSQQRHTLNELGFLYTGELIYDAYIKYKHKAKEYAKYEGTISFDNKQCHKIKLENKEYALKDYVIQNGENIITIAKKFKLDEYSLLEFNPNIKSYTAVKSGQTIKIPNTFCKTVVIYVDGKTLLPIYQKMDDQNGFVGEYEFRDLQINIPIPDAEFSKAFEGPIPEMEEVLADMVEQMMTNIRAVKTAKYHLIKNERYEGKIIKSEQEIKQNVNPMKVYLKILKGPHSGTELVYVKGKNEDKALVSAGSVVPTISLSLFSPLVRDKQRHTLYELGFLYTGDLIYDSYLKYKDKAEEYTTYEGTIMFDNRTCHKVTLDNKEYKLKDYTVQEGENLIKIARRLKLDEYSLLEYNPSVKDYTAVKPGQVIKIPDTFCKKVIMYIDAKTFLPVYQKTFDQNGFVAEYEYRKLHVNILIPDKEFEKDYEGYGF